MQPGRRSLLVHPLPLAALAVLVLNDHWLKHAHPSWLTGKLSDFAGLIIAPLLLCELALLVWPRAPRRALISSIALAVGSAFALIKLVPACSALYVRFSTALLAPLGLHASSSMDATDLVALLVLPPTVLWATHRAASGPR